jgi:hypothetical protein
MSDQGGGAAEAIGHPFVAIGGWIAGFVPEGPLRTLVLVIEGLCVALAPFIFAYYLKLLAHGGAEDGSIERQDYDRLRASLAGDNLAARLYAKWLTIFLDWVERFFGDVGMADRTLFPHAFGLKKPAPLWTASALDRCLLLALIYPIATIFVIWVVSGHVGPAEKALGLIPGVHSGYRAIVVAALGLLTFAYSPWLQSPRWKRLIRAIGFIAFFNAVLVAGCNPVVVTMGAVVVFNAVVFTFAGAFVFGLVITIGSAAASAHVAVEPSFITVVLMVAVFSGSVVLGAIFDASNDEAITHKQQGLFLALFLPVIFLVCLVAPILLASNENWGTTGSILLFLGLLTLLNAPFDWASLGLTRALLRRGLELRGWWPLILAFLDAALAIVIIALLALTMVIGVQAFDELAGAWRRRKGCGAAPPCPLRRHRQESSGARILVGLCALALDHDPEPGKSRHRRHGFHARDSGIGAASLELDTRRKRCARLSAAARGACPRRSDVCGCLPRHRGAGVARLGADFPYHASHRPRSARRGPRRRGF